MATYPLPREVRMSDILEADGVTAVFGPFAFKIFDTADATLFTRASAGEAWEATPATIAKTTADPLAFFTVEPDDLLPDGTEYVVVGLRLHERSVDVVQGGVLLSAQLEKELSKQGQVLQELRRDMDRCMIVGFGETTPLILARTAGRSAKWDADGNLGVSDSNPDALATAVNDVLAQVQDIRDEMLLLRAEETALRAEIEGLRDLVLAYKEAAEAAYAAMVSLPVNGQLGIEVFATPPLGTAFSAPASPAGNVARFLVLNGLISPASDFTPSNAGRTLTATAQQMEGVDRVILVYDRP